MTKPPIMLPPSYDYPCYLWQEDGQWQWSIPEIKIQGWGFDTIEDAKHHIYEYLRLPPNRGAVWHECKPGVYAQGLQDETDD